MNRYTLLKYKYISSLCIITRKLSFQTQRYYTYISAVSWSKQQTNILTDNSFKYILLAMCCPSQTFTEYK